VSVALLLLVALGQTDARFFDTKVAPILRKRCLGCHNNELTDGGISFQNPSTLLKGGSRGPAIVPGQPGDSVMIRAIRQQESFSMPPGRKLSAKEVATITKWVQGGAVWGSDLR
jgi:hypothetical protein